MSDMIDIKINTKQLEKALNLFPKRLQEQMYDTLDHVGRSFYSRLWQNPGVRTSRYGLGKFMGFTSYSKSHNPGVAIWGYSPVTKIHAEGGIVVAKGGKYLSIPIGDALTAKGKVKKKYLNWTRLRGKSLMKLQNKQTGKERTFLIKRNGKIYLAEAKKEGKKWNTNIIFALVKRVSIPKRFRFWETWNEHESRRNELINKAVDTTINKFYKA